MIRKTRAITIKDVAKAANVSITTVSRVLNNNLSSVNDETRERIKAVIRDLQYVPNAMARGIRAEKTRTIGLIIQDINNPYYPGIVLGVESTAQKLGFSLILANSQRSRAHVRRYLQLMWEKRVDGLILAGGDLGRELDSCDLPGKGSMKAVVIGKTRPEAGVSVQIDNIGAGKMACEFLLRHGHRNIAMITGVANSPTSIDREAGYRMALEAHGVTPQRRWTARGNFVYDGGYAAVGKLPLEQITAIFAHNDLMAIGAINALTERGYRVPGDISVIGFDGILPSSYIFPGLTTIQVPFEAVGKRAVESLVKLMNGRKVENTSYIPVSIVERGTVGDCAFQLHSMVSPEFPNKKAPAKKPAKHK